MDVVYIDKCQYDIQEKISSGMLYRHVPAHFENLEQLFWSLTVTYGLLGNKWWINKQ
jgi:hypothetical protein